ncbi:MAG: hypothetical protein M1812_002167 [Candelaria pacifica]|nr:MAG: hypothetical protein M1812_002167 [Candelaria pacifica]
MHLALKFGGAAIATVNGTVENGPDGLQTDEKTSSTKGLLDGKALAAMHPSQRSRILIYIFILLTILLFFRSVPSFLYRFLFNETSDLNYSQLFSKRLKTYIMTHDCGRYTSSLATDLSDDTTLVTDNTSDPQCTSLNLPLLQTTLNEQAENQDQRYIAKYSQVLTACSHGVKMLCLILEDDAVFLHTPSRTREVLVQNTITYHFNEDSAYDCGKRGNGWFPSSQTGLGSLCRIYSKDKAGCMAGCLVEPKHPLSHADLELMRCQMKCQLVQKRFLLVQHTGLPSTMNRQEERPKDVA